MDGSVQARPHASHWRIREVSKSHGFEDAPALQGHPTAPGLGSNADSEPATPILLWRAVLFFSNDTYDIAPKKPAIIGAQVQEVNADCG